MKKKQPHLLNDTQEKFPKEYTNTHRQNLNPLDYTVQDCRVLYYSPYCM